MKTLLATLVIFVLSVSATPIAGPATGCSAVHVITARASTEAPGEGIIGTVVSDVVAGSGQTVSREAIAYPATLTDYLESESSGVIAMKSRLAATASSCPDTKIVLMGYSQGAQVSGDVLASNASGSNKVVAAILMGDPGHIRGESFQKGTANQLNGLFPRAPGALNTFASVINSFCDIGDPFCAGGSDLAVHLGSVLVSSNTRVDVRHSVLNGDLITGENTFRENSTTLIDQIVGPLNEAKVPFSSTHGNHDNQANITHAEEILREQQAAPLSYTRMAPRGVGGIGGPGNYWVPIYLNSFDSSPALVLWFFDSRGGFSPGPNSTRFPDWVDGSVADWIKTETRGMNIAWGSAEKRGALAFVHIPPHIVTDLQKNLDSEANPGLNAWNRYGGYTGDGWGYGVRNLHFVSPNPTDGVKTWIRLEAGETRAQVTLNKKY
ncbi:hypothetical protein H0H87_011234 [Tephrocybe sp. NHM501043]|nr:hypothetical protein H0H87_011234 [Tephrocybe sp. NHM501043]